MFSGATGHFSLPRLDKQKENDQQTSVQVEGSLTNFTQTGLAAGQQYTVSVTGEIGGRRGAETTGQFTTRELLQSHTLHVSTGFDLRPLLSWSSVQL